MIASVWVLFAGFFINYDDIPIFLRWISYLSPIRYGLEAIFKSEFQGRTFTCTEAEIAAGCFVKSGTIKHLSDNLY